MIIYVLFIMSAVMLAWLVTSYVKDDKFRMLALIPVLVMLFSGPFTYIETLSKPKHINEEYLRNDKEAEVINYLAKPGEGLYIWLSLKGVTEPRYYYMDWNEKTKELAQKLQDGFEAKQKMMMALPFEKSLEKEKQRQVYPIPQTKLPDKPEEHMKGREVPSYGI